MQQSKSLRLQWKSSAYITCYTSSYVRLPILCEPTHNLTLCQSRPWNLHGLLARYAKNYLPYLHQTVVTYPRTCDPLLFPFSLPSHSPFVPSTSLTAPFYAVSLHVSLLPSPSSLRTVLIPHIPQLSKPSHPSSPARSMTYYSSSSTSTHTKFRLQSSLPHSGCLSLIPFLRTAHCSQVSPLSLNHLLSLLLRRGGAGWLADL